MKRRQTLIFAAAILVTSGIIIGLIISAGLNFPLNVYTQETKISSSSLELLGKINEAMSEVAAAVKPAIVNISSTKTIHMRGAPSPFSDDPFLRYFFGDAFRDSNKPGNYKQSGLGSGVIVNRDGYILTNYHVVKDADEIKVRLGDKRVFKGRIIGTDSKTDLAVIKINAGNLPALKLGDSDQLKVGETVLAVGNPFGLSQTVTSGIVSAKGRADVGLAEYEDFIQTDAAVNPGNSGGALVNIRGELIGINTAIYSQSGGNEGIGFAVPSNMVKVVMDSLIRKGKVVRGWLGISIQPLTPELARQLKVKSEKGALIADVIDESPAAKAGLKSGDVVTYVDGKETNDASELRNMIAAMQPGREVKIKFLRGGVENTITVKIGEMTTKEDEKAEQLENQFKGIMVQNLTPVIRQELKLPRKQTGVVVANVAEDSPGALALTEGDVIVEINRQRINNVGDYRKAVARINAGQEALLLIYREGSTIYLTL